MQALIHCGSPTTGARVPQHERRQLVSSDDKDQIDHLVVDLTRELGERVGPNTVRDEVKKVYDSFARAKIRQYVPALTRKIVREQLLKPQAQAAST